MLDESRDEGGFTTYLEELTDLQNYTKELLLLIRFLVILVYPWLHTSLRQYTNTVQSQ